VSSVPINTTAIAFLLAHFGFPSSGASSECQASIGGCTTFRKGDGTVSFLALTRPVIV
jgi:hypothetical protein